MKRFGMSYLLLSKAWPKIELSRGSKIICLHTGMYEFSQSARYTHYIMIEYILLFLKTFIIENNKHPHFSVILVLARQACFTNKA